MSSSFFKPSMVLLAAISGLGLMGAECAIAQVTVNRDPNTGAVRVNRNAYTLDTGTSPNNSNIPLPSDLPNGTSDGDPIDTNTDGSLAPNSVIFSTDLDYIQENFTDVINGNASGPTYTLQNNSVTVTTGFDINRLDGEHGFGEGIQVTVFDANNNVVSNTVVNGNGQTVANNRVFVRGDGVTIGPEGQQLNESETLFVTYENDQRVELKILHLRDNNSREETESGVYFTSSGEVIAEDFPGGGDRDFDDGDFLNLRVGQGEAIAVEEDSSITVTTEVEETALEPEIRRESIVEADVIETVETSEDVVTEERIRGSVEVSDGQAPRLGHAVGVHTENDEQLVYNRYAGTAQVRAGTDGFTATGQLAPLLAKPSIPPTLLTGELTFNPWVDDGQAGLIAAIGLTQFLNPTHRLAENAFGNLIQQPESEDTRLVEPTGFLNNRRLVGYVPAIPEETLQGEQLTSVKGIFSLPEGQSILISPPDSQQVGPGSSAYADNVGGLLIEGTDGSMTFVPQWTKAGYANTPISLAAGEATSIIYALVPQQSGQNLRLGQRYSVTSSAGEYRITDGNFRIISADRQPQNFLQETAEVYAVEDTVATGNAATALFNGVQGVYIEASGDRDATVDLTQPADVDARVGNRLNPVVTRLADQGQLAYARTTRAAGLYLGGSLTGGIGNQQDTVTRQTATVEVSTDQRRTQQIINTFVTPVIQVTETATEVTEITRSTGLATFEIGTDGLLQNANFSPTSTETLESQRRDLGTTTSTEVGEEVLTDSVTQQTVETLAVRTNVVEQDESTGTDSYANAAPVRGELALGGVLNFGNTPWTPAANTLRAELFLSDIVIGQGGEGFRAGWRAAMTYHPFGEHQRAAHQYDEAGNVVPIYKTVPVLEANGDQLVEQLVDADGNSVDLAVNEFAVDEAGDRIAQTVGTGRSKGPGVYVRIQDVWDDGDSVSVDGGVQLSF